LLKKLLPHICIILSLVTLTFLVLDQFNPTFFGKAFFHVELLIYGVFVLILSATVVARNRKKKPRRNDQPKNPRPRYIDER